MRHLGLALIQCDWYFYKKSKFGHRHIQKWDNVKTWKEKNQGKKHQKKK